MGALVRIVDEHLGRGRQQAFQLRLASERITARELVQRRVAEEVALANGESVSPGAGQGPAHSFLIRFDPNPVETVLNAPKPSGKAARPANLDEREEIEAANSAFELNAFIMLVDDRQVAGLDEPLTLMADSEVVFLRLTPLVGG